MSSRLEQLRQLEQGSPEDDFILYTIGLELLKSNRTEAEEYFEKNISLNPNYLATYYQLGKLKIEKGAFESAVEIIKKGIEVAKSQKNNHTLSELNFLLEDAEDEL